MSDALVDGLLPADVAVAWAAVDAPVDACDGALFPEEHALVVKAVPKRQREFTQGRVCARRALATLGVPPGALLVGSMREPLWPAGVVGSITHDRELCVAAVGSAERYAGIGIDVEPDEPLTDAVAARIWSPVEAAQARGVVAASSAAKLVFSAKEAVYKCQFPLTQTYLGFAAVRMTLGEGTFEAVLVASAGPLPGGLCFRGRWRRESGKLLTAVWLERASVLSE